MTFELVDPRGEVHAADGSTITARAGAVPETVAIGFLINEVSRQSGPDFTRYTEVVEDVLRGRYREVTVVRDAKPVLSRPAETGMLRKFVHCRGVVTGLAK